MWKAAWLAAPVFIAVVVGWFSPWNASLHDDSRLASSTATGPSLEALLRPSPPLACGELDALLQGAASAQAAFEAAVTACSPQSQAQELRTTQFRHHVTALSHSYRECLRRSLGSSSSSSVAVRSALRDGL